MCLVTLRRSTGFSNAWATTTKKTLRADEQGRKDIVEARARWRMVLAELDVNRLVFLDESGAKTNMTRLRGRSKGGTRCHDRAPHGHWATTTMISSIRIDGSTACMVINGATSGRVFREYVRQVLAPVLKPGDIVISDNLSPHKDLLAKEFIGAAGAQHWLLPAYSPDLNPIEKMWSKVKETLRAAKARNHEAFIAAIGQALERIRPDDAKGWFQSCGYLAYQ